jgi:hypothetical protein
MGVGDLEGKIGELNGQLRGLVPTLEALGRKVTELGERAAANKESLRQIWEEIHGIKRREDGGARKWWQVVLALISAVIGAVVTAVVLKLMKGTP